MSNGDDTVEMCCAIGLCCGGDDDVKQKKALKKLITHYLGDEPPTLDNIVAVLVDVWDLTPKGWGWGTLMKHIGYVAREHPYRGPGGE